MWIVQEIIVTMFKRRNVQNKCDVKNLRGIDFLLFIFFKFYLLWLCAFLVILNLILLEPKVIRLCHQYRARLACTSMQSDQALYCWQTNFKVGIMLYKKDNGQFQKWNVDYSI